MPSYLVVGGGISGLAAAVALLDADPEAQVTVLEGSDRVGGKLRGEEVAGRRVDVGAEAVLARRPEALELIERAGLSDEVVHPTGASAQVWSRGRLHPMPRRTMMGVPADPGSLRGLLTDDEVDRALAEVASRTDLDDISVGDLVADRLGPAVLDRLVEPLLGGVYAGHARLLSARAALPQLLAVARQGGSLTAAVDRMFPAPTDGTQSQGAKPVFATVRGGLHRLPEALAELLTERGVTIRTSTLARELRALPEGGFEVVTGPRPAPTAYRADRLVLAVPPAPAARLLASLAPDAAQLLQQVETASMAVITLALPSAELGDLTGPSPEGQSGGLLGGGAPRPSPEGQSGGLLGGGAPRPSPEGQSGGLLGGGAPRPSPEGQSGGLLGGGAPRPSGFLVPPVEDLRIKAATFSANKWAWVAELGRGAGPDGQDLIFLRASIGRHREEATLQHPDDELVEVARADLARVLGRDLPAHVDAHVQRWGGGLPQYAVGHVDLVAQVRAAVDQVPGLAVCGAAYDGVGIPACIASARRAADQLAQQAAQPERAAYPTDPASSPAHARSSTR
ncbi:protoporphyrinogen oxidase [Ornithinimicrobium sufpigmenti]|uniref:protoporphyrinogen oxidase n=1 Tax=Ornithinimicrobium sufpigmenti TaxID=2508882 RepID=UPI001EE154BA|nr:protoporphyrinogen oxidase [Ornithinimicrobium sp. HY006]